MFGAKKKVTEDEDETPQQRSGGDNEEEGSSKQQKKIFDISELVQNAKTWISENKTIAIVIFSSICFAVLIILLLIVWHIISVYNRPTIDQAFNAYQYGAVTQARAMAESVLRYAGDSEKEKRATALYVIGASLIDQYESIGWSDKESYILTAANYLKEANEIGFPDSIKTNGLLYLANALFLTGNMPQSTEILLLAEQQPNQDMKAVYGMLAEALCQKEDADYNLALRYCDLYLNNLNVTQTEMDRAKLLQTTVLIRLGRLDEAIRVYDSIPIKDEYESQQEFVGAQILIEQARNFRERARELERELALTDSPFEIHSEYATEVFDFSTDDFEPDDGTNEPTDEPLPIHDQDETDIDEFEPDLDDAPIVEPPVSFHRGIPVVVLMRYQNERTDNEIIDLKPGYSDQGFQNEGLPRVKYYRDNALAKYNEALLRLEMAKYADASEFKYTTQSMLLQGICFEEMGEFAKAIAMYVELAKLHPESDDAIAAEFLRAEILRKQGKLDAAIAAYHRSMTMFGQKGTYINSWLPRKNIVERIRIAFVSSIQLKHFEEGFNTLAVVENIVPKADLVRMKAVGYDRWATDLWRQAEASAYEERIEYQKSAREKNRLAGRWYTELARHDFATPAFPEDIWNSAENYRIGKDYIKAIPMYREYLKTELTLRQAETLSILGQLYFELDLLDKSIETYDQFIETYPQHPLIYRVRLIKNYAHQEKNETKKAELLLLENLSGILGPQSPEYRDSIYALGKMYYSRRNREKTIQTLEDAVFLHPNAIQAAQSHYMIAQSYLALAETSDQKVASTNLTGVRREASDESKRNRASALQYFIDAKTRLIQRESMMPLSTAEQTMLMVCYFEIAKQELLLERLPEALESFKAAQNRYQSRPETLDAVIQTAQIYKKLGENDKAIESINRGKVLLQKLTASKAFPPGYRFNETEWKDLLQWQSGI